MVTSGSKQPNNEATAMMPNLRLPSSRPQTNGWRHGGSVFIVQSVIENSLLLFLYADNISCDVSHLSKKHHKQYFNKHNTVFCLPHCRFLCYPGGRTLVLEPLNAFVFLMCSHVEHNKFIYDRISQAVVSLSVNLFSLAAEENIILGKQLEAHLTTGVIFLLIKKQMSLVQQ